MVGFKGANEKYTNFVGVFEQWDTLSKLKPKFPEERGPDDICCITKNLVLMLHIIQ